MKYADYIKQVEIDALWNGRKHIKWELDPKVNILSGVNGDGKSTILRRTMRGAKTISLTVPSASNPHGSIPLNKGSEGVSVTTVPEDAEYVRYDWIATPDVRSEYDINLQSLLKRYDAATHDEERRNRLFDIVDDLFRATHKAVDRTKETFTLMFWGEPLDFQVLSSGEKQMLTILLAVYLENNEHYVLFMDEPEVSLHVEWQKKLIGIIQTLNPNVQIILSTHSPAMIMDGWLDKVTEVSEIEV